ncbi:MAG TPA: asparagine synthase (glutamine-hydrolyzing) [Bryobacteraceae bacterium]|nr:asparagine synthase (glutamine-hydrolyzing) [Bryobacteraceae bacterium]
MMSLLSNGERCAGAWGGREHVCGILGYTHFGRKPSAAVLRRATEKLRHRGPDQHDYHEGPDVSLAAVRLKVIDLQGGDQPMCTEDGECTLAFNGEIYNHAEIRRDLEQRGHRFQSHCDTEVVLRAFVEWDTDCFSRFRGMFAAAFWQRSTRRLVLVRDRLGIKPLYYAVRDGNIYFGSELKVIFEHPQIPRRLSRTGLGYFLSLNYVPGPHTLVEGIEKLAPGTWLECSPGQIKTEVYWRNVFHPQKLSLHEACEQLDHLLQKSVQEHLVSDVPLGIWASGGLDSSTLLHYAAQQCSRQLQTFSISFSGRECDERRYFRPLAERYQTRHHEFDLGSDVDLTSAIHDISYYSDEPSADAGALPIWFLSRLTSQHVTVALSGDGADEIFGGYQTYLADIYARRIRCLPVSLRRLATRAAGWIPVSDEKIGLDYKIKRFLAGTLLSDDEAHFYWNGTFSRAEQIELGFNTSPESTGELCRKLGALPVRSGNADRYLYTDQHYYLPDDILYKCDRMSMAHSLEVRPPFLDHRIVEFAAQLPTHLKIGGGRTKRVLRALMRDKLPAEVLERSKEGLDIPAHCWLRGPLQPLLSDALNPDLVRKTGLFDPNAIRTLVKQHVSREANWGYHLWGLVTLHLWIRRWDIETGEVAKNSLCADMALAAG